MTDQPADPFSTGLVYEDQLPLYWQVIDKRPEEVHGLPLHASNEDVLRSLSILEEHPQEIDEDHPAVAHELRRLDFKLNLLLDMVGLLVARDLALPARVPLRLAAHGLEWSTGQPPALGSLVQLDIYLSNKLARPLVLHGRIQSHTPAAGGRSRVVAEFEGLSDLESDWLEKIIFVHHRREVAHARRAPH